MKTLFGLLISLLIFLTAVPSWATFPVVESVATTADIEGLSTVLNMPSGIVAGNLLLAFCSHISVTTQLTESGTSVWTRVGSAAGSGVTQALFLKLAAGSDTLTVAGTTNGDTACAVLRVSNHAVTDVSTEVYLSAVTSATTDAPDPNAVTPGISNDYKIFEALHIATAAPAVNSYSTGYTEVANLQSAVASNNTRIAVADKNITGTTDDPDAASVAASQQIRTIVVAVPGVASAAGTISNTGACMVLGVMGC